MTPSGADEVLRKLRVYVEALAQRHIAVASVTDVHEKRRAFDIAERELRAALIRSDLNHISTIIDEENKR